MKSQPRLFSRAGGGSFSVLLWALTMILTAGAAFCGGDAREALADDWKGIWTGVAQPPRNCSTASPMPISTEPTVRTDQMGGVAHPSKAALLQMHKSQYILHAAGGKLSRVAVEKVLLPHSNSMSPQRTQVDLGPDGTVYVKQEEMLCKSTDGGRTWSTTPINPGAGVAWRGRWKVLGDGTFIRVGCKNGKNVRDPAIVWVSTDEGKTWSRRAEIPIEMNLPNGKPYDNRQIERGLSRLKDDTLLWVLDIRDDPYTESYGNYSFRSTDGGRTWEGPTFLCDWGFGEGASTLLPSGKILAVGRYQRPKVDSDTDPPDPRGYKNVFLMDSDDGGLMWSKPRQLTTAYGQTYGYPAALSNGTVVVVHDTRYGPGPIGSRAMVSYDEGETWIDEVYYLDTSAWSGSYSASVGLADDTILTIAGSSQVTDVNNNTDFYAIRWKPVAADVR